MTAATETWLDVMLAIPLARGVLVVDAGGTRRIALWASDGDYWWFSSAKSPIGPGLPNEIDARTVRVDLDDPQGFGYALRWRWAVVEYRLRAGDKRLIEGAIIRHLNGETTDADRLSLARACAEVAHG